MQKITNLNDLLKICLCIAGLGVFYHYVIYIPNLENRKLEQAELKMQIEKDKLEQEKTRRLDDLKWKEEAMHQELINKEILLEECLDEAYSAYRNSWAVNCQSSGINNKGRDCNLPHHTSDSLAHFYQQRREECILRHK